MLKNEQIANNFYADQLKSKFREINSGFVDPGLDVWSATIAVLESVCP